MNVTELRMKTFRLLHHITQCSMCKCYHMWLSIYTLHYYPHQQDTCCTIIHIRTCIDHLARLNNHKTTSQSMD